MDNHADTCMKTPWRLADIDVFVFFLQMSDHQATWKLTDDDDDLATRTMVLFSADKLDSIIGKIEEAVATWRLLIKCMAVQTVNVFIYLQECQCLCEFV